MAVKVSRVKPSNCFRHLEKLVLGLPSIFDDVELAELSKKQCCMKECNILGGSKHTPTPFTYFRGEQDNQDLRTVA